MSEQTAGTESLECAEIVYRALKKGLAANEPIPPEAFLRRVNRPDPEKELSLARRKYVTARECRSKLNRMRGVASLHVGKVRNLPWGLDVLPDPLCNEEGVVSDPGHCLLINLPDPVSDEEAAEVVASQLIKIARYVTPEQEEQEHRERRGTI